METFGINELDVIAARQMAARGRTWKAPTAEEMNAALEEVKGYRSASNRTYARYGMTKGAKLYGGIRRQ